MPAARDVTDNEIDGLVAFVRSLSIGDAPGAVTGGTDPDSTIRSVMRHLQLAMASARSGHRK